jgi:hypothetical protein
MVYTDQVSPILVRREWSFGDLFADISGNRAPGSFRGRCQQWNEGARRTVSGRFSQIGWRSMTYDKPEEGRCKPDWTWTLGSQVVLGGVDTESRLLRFAEAASHRFSFV